MLRNVDAQIQGDKLVITIDLNAKGTTSKSGKSEILATTGGFIGVSTGKPGGMISLSLNVTK